VGYGMFVHATVVLLHLRSASQQSPLTKFSSVVGLKVTSLAPHFRFFLRLQATFHAPILPRASSKS